MKRQTLLLLALGSCALGGFVSCQKAGDAAAENAAASAPAVTVFPLQLQEVTDFGEWFGYVRGEMDTDIRPRVTGFLASQEYEDGQYVKAGDVLFRIDDAVFRARLEEAQAALAAAEATVGSAEAAVEQTALDLKRFENMGTRIVAEKDISDARQRAKSARAGLSAAHAAVEQAKADVEQAKINLEWTVIRAPFNGVAGTAGVSRGELVSPAATLCNLSAVDTVRVQFAINGEHMIDVFRKYGDVSRPGNGAENTPLYLVQENGETYPIEGRFSALESKVSPNGVINVEGRFANPTRTLRAGMPVRVRVPVDRRNAMLVPKDAVRTVLRNRFILFTDKEGVPHMARVKVTGEYPVTVKEPNGYVSTQTMVAVEDAGQSLTELFRSFGYENPAEVPVVCDAQNGVIAMNVSSANSRLPQGQKPESIKTEHFTFKPQPDPALVAAANAAEKKDDAQPAQKPAAAPTLPPFPVKVCPMVLQNVQVPGEWFGTLRGVEETEVRPQVSGMLISQDAADGHMVKKGDVLFTLDPAPYRAALDAARANVAVAKADAEQKAAEQEMARLNFDRYTRMMKENPGVLSAKTVTDAETALKTADAALLKSRANVTLAESAVRQAEINLGYTTVTAPFDGRVGIHKYSLGSQVSPQDPQPLVTISSVNPIRVDFHISGKDALEGFSYFAKTRSAGKDPAESAPLDILLEDGSLYPAKGKIQNADNALDPATGTLRITALVENADGGLRSGMPVRVRADISGAQQSVLVPARAPLSAGGRDVLVLLAPDNSPQVLPITKLGMVTVPVKGADGNEVTQPMQMIDVDRTTVGALVLLKTGAPTLEALLLQQAGVPDWESLLLKNAGVADFKALAEKTAGGKTLPDDLPASIGAADWREYVLHSSGHGDFRSIVLAAQDAADELDLMARAQGFGTVFEMVLKEMGYKSLEETRVVAEGSIMAAMTFQANQAAGAPVNKLTPTPFEYVAPKTVVDSVTAEQQ